MFVPLMTKRLKGVLALDDLERRAKKYLPQSVFSFVASGAETEASVHDARASFARWRFVPRTLVDVSKRNHAVTLFGQTFNAPFGIAPMGGAVICAFEADLALARGAAQAGVPFVLSGASTIAVEQVMAAAPGTWFQAYLSHDEKKTEAMLARLERAGVNVLIVTVDVPVMGARENALRAGFSMPPVITPRLAWDGLTHPEWLVGAWLRTWLNGAPHQENFDAERGPSIMARKVAPSDRRSRFSWGHIAHIRRLWRGPLLLKGVLSPEDARLARTHGVDGLILSNHGGRQLDGALAPLDALPDVLEAAPDLTLLVDGGVRRGSDVLKARALGAHAVLVGRPFLYAAALGGEGGVKAAADLLTTEIDRTLALLGCPNLADLNLCFLK